MNLKSIIQLLSILLLISSCDYEKDIFEQLKGDPQFNFIYNGAEVEEINDSIKVSLDQLGKKSIDFKLKIVDKSKAIDLKIERFNGNGTARINNDEVETTVQLNNGSIDVSYVPLQEGEHKITFSVVDQYGQKKERSFRLFIFHNLPPVGVLDVTKIGQNSDYEIEISAFKSYDQDAKWGGQVKKYRYKIGNYYSYETENFSSIKHICPGPGKYIVSLQVIDDDGGISQNVFTEITF